MRFFITASGPFETDVVEQGGRVATCWLDDTREPGFIIELWWSTRKQRFIHMGERENDEDFHYVPAQSRRRRDSARIRRLLGPRRRADLGGSAVH